MLHLFKRLDNRKLSKVVKIKSMIHSPATLLMINRIKSSTRNLKQELLKSPQQSGKTSKNIYAHN